MADEPSMANDAGMAPPIPPCSRCGTTAPPLESGQCSNDNPRCRVFRVGHQLSRKYAIDDQDVRVKTNKFIGEFHASTEDEIDLCREYAIAVLTLRKIRLGTQERVRARQERNELRAELRAIRTAHEATVDPPIVRRVIVRASDWQRDVDTTAPRVDPGDSPQPTETPRPAETSSSPIVSEPAAPEPCPYCHQTPARCAEIKATQPENWRALHYSDPEEVKRRAEDAEDQLEAYRRGWPTERMIDRAREREVFETDEQRQQRELRERIGWESPGSTFDADTGRRR